ncbi:hypothetical protein CTI14_03990 [Methylobacterium radiotolerans]|nr:hypothetical protein CTI14_03990 [Methylobacterium radiotolerans]
MIDPSLADRIADYLWAVLGSWWGVLSVILGLVRLSPTLMPELQPMADAIQKQRHVLVSVALTLFVVANFQIYDRAQREIRQAATRPATFDYQSLPKSIDGLKPGDLWLNGGTIAVVQP